MLTVRVDENYVIGDQIWQHFFRLTVESSKVVGGQMGRGGERVQGRLHAGQVTVHCRRQCARRRYGVAHESSALALVAIGDQHDGHQRRWDDARDDEQGESGTDSWDATWPHLSLHAVDIDPGGDRRLEKAKNSDTAAQRIGITAGLIVRHSSVPIRYAGPEAPQ